MKRLISEWKSLKTEYPWLVLLDAAFGGFLLSTLAFAPVFLALGELIVVFMHWKTWLFLVITLAAMVYFYLIAQLMFQSLALKKPDHVSDLRLLRRTYGLIGAGFALVAGLLFTFVLMPIVWI